MVELWLPSRGLTYPTWGKGKSSSNMPYQGDMLIPWRVTQSLSIYIWSFIQEWWPTTTNYWLVVNPHLLSGLDVVRNNSSAWLTHLCTYPWKFGGGSCAPNLVCQDRCVSKLLQQRFLKDKPLLFVGEVGGSPNLLNSWTDSIHHSPTLWTVSHNSGLGPGPFQQLWLSSSGVSQHLNECCLIQRDQITSRFNGVVSTYLFEQLGL